MSADVKGRIVEYFLLQELLLLIFVHISLQKMKRGVGFLHLNGFALALLFLEDGAEVAIFSVVLAALHRLMLN